MAEVPQTAEDRSAVRNVLLRQAKAACAAGRNVEAERVLLEYFNFSVRCQLADALLDQNTAPEELASLQEAVHISEAGLKTLAAAAAAAARARQLRDAGPVSHPAAVIDQAEFRKNASVPLTAGLLSSASGDLPSSDATLVALDTRFWELVDPGTPVISLEEANYSFAHEAPVWLPETRQLFFVSNRLADPATGTPLVRLFLLSINSGELQEVQPEPPILMANGATNYGPGRVLVCAQGLNDTPGGLVVLDLHTSKSTPLLNNWGGLPFSSPNDVAVHGPSSSILFTDPSYGYAQGFRPAPQLGPWVWRFHPATNATAPVVTAGLVKPNRVAFSPDFTTAYVSDTGAVDGSGAPANFSAVAPAVYAFDVLADDGPLGLPTLANRRLFGMCPSGVPDGIKVDSQGNIYAGVPGGVDVFAPDGTHLGSIATGATANLAFAGRQLLMLQEQRVAALRMRSAGVRLPLQAAEGRGSP